MLDKRCGKGTENFRWQQRKFLDVGRTSKGCENDLRRRITNALFSSNGFVETAAVALRKFYAPLECILHSDCSSGEIAILFKHFLPLKKLEKNDGVENIHDNEET